MVKNKLTMQEAWVKLQDQEDPLEKEMATYPSILAWEIPWTEEPGRLQFMKSQRVRHDLVTKQQHWSGHYFARKHSQLLSHTR